MQIYENTRENPFEKNSYFSFRIDERTKKKFQDITKRQAINTSELFRQWIEAYIAEHTK